MLFENEIKKKKQFTNAYCDKAGKNNEEIAEESEEKKQ